MNTQKQILKLSNNARAILCHCITFSNVMKKKSLFSWVWLNKHTGKKSSTEVNVEVTWKSFNLYCFTMCIWKSLSPSDGRMRYCRRLTTSSSLSADLELLLTHCVGVWAWALLSSALIFSSVTSSTFSALRNACASWNTEDKGMKTRWQVE